ncbi:Transmembrane domain-containing protein [Brazilian cedratvirus IHUMI]|uniref:Transmembrane domain-containing protein n=1 Tax=Brazilian cedratvirus IHUMI TaxID=2126980 RepID=A0A2R8FCY1_9VIRU|nr:Transmembrane domain-containing protein [Brazilian cedratvirus IHUMI]
MDGYMVSVLLQLLLVGILVFLVSYLIIRPVRNALEVLTIALISFFFAAPLVLFIIN